MFPEYGTLQQQRKKFCLLKAVQPTGCVYECPLFHVNTRLEFSTRPPPTGSTSMAGLWLKMGLSRAQKTTQKPCITHRWHCCLREYVISARLVKDTSI